MNIFSGKFICLSKPSISALLLLACASCNGEEENGVTVFVSGCGDPEIHSDILHSIDSVGSYAESKGVEIKIDDSINKCGYLFTSETKMYIDEALTDHDLMMKIDSFFQKTSP